MKFFLLPFIFLCACTPSRDVFFEKFTDRVVEEYAECNPYVDPRGIRLMVPQIIDAMADCDYSGKQAKACLASDFPCIESPFGPEFNVPGFTEACEKVFVCDD